jgi:8-oxo-dGTP diphosphatase
MEAGRNAIARDDRGDYKWGMKTQRVAVKALIVEGDKVLLLKRSANEEVYKKLWDIPGGRTEWGETALDALAREVREEANLKVSVKQVWDTWHFIRSDNESQVIGITFICRRVSGRIKLSNEHTEYKWATVAEVKKLPMNDGMRKGILKYLTKR